jgi:signal transduction histidine kinase/CheY-like chemotaxis protein
MPLSASRPSQGRALAYASGLLALAVAIGGIVFMLFRLAELPDRGGLAFAVWVASFLVAGAVLLSMGAKLHAVRARSSRTEEDLSSQVRDMQALHELGSRVMLIPDLKGQLTAILRTLCDLQGTDKGVVWLVDPSSNRLTAVASTGVSAEGLSALHEIPAGGGASGSAFMERRTVIVEDAEQDPRFEGLRNYARSEGFRAVHARPLASPAGDVFGVLTLHFRDARAPSSRDNQLADLCSQLASVLAERELLRRDALSLSRKVEVALESSAVPFCLFSPLRDAHGALVDFHCDYLNGAAARTFERDASQLIGHPVRQSVPAAWDEPGLLRSFEAVLQRQATVEFEFESRTRRTPTWFHVIASPCEGGLAVWFSDVSERKHHEHALHDADRRKDEFLATLAHELRNPLAPIRQAAMIARSPLAKPEQRRWSLDVIDRQVGNMAVLLDDLLDVSRITRGKLELRKAVTDLREVVESALEATRPAMDARQQQLVFEWPALPLWAHVDPIRMAQVVSNLLTNACKYTQPEGTIWLTGRAEDGEAVIEVKDNGIGIPPDALEMVFEMFTQVRTPQSGPTMGLGIGLALSRGLAQMHGATLTARSGGTGLGSTFTLRVAMSGGVAQPKPADVAATNRGECRRVLVADDNRDAAESLGEMLRMAGHEVTLAFDGESALQQFRQAAPDVALLDIGMPRMTGNEVAAAIRASAAGNHTVLVAITGWGQERDRAAAKEAGFDFHFTKPVDPEQVLRLIEDPQAARQVERMED